MVKNKKVQVFCSACGKNLYLEVPYNLADNREYYPFEYIHIHGDPQHALMMFFDAHLAIRDAIAYNDIVFAKKHKTEFNNLVRMSENEALLSIYSDPLRFKLYKLLIQGPMTEDGLIDALEAETDFKVQNFNTLILPLIKTGLVRAKWISVTFFECYFLIKDFIAIRIPFKNQLGENKDYGLNQSSYDIYAKRKTEFFTKYSKTLLSNKDALIEESKNCLEILTNTDYLRIIRSMRLGTRTLDELLEFVELKPIQDLVYKNIIFEHKVKMKIFYTLLCDIMVLKFTPKYMLNIITQKYKNKAISFEMANMHLDLLYENN